MDKELKERYFKLVDNYKKLVDEIDKLSTRVERLRLSLSNSSLREMILTTLNSVGESCRTDVVKLSLIYYPSQLTELALNMSEGLLAYTHGLEGYEEDLNYYSEKLQKLNILLSRL